MDKTESVSQKTCKCAERRLKRNYILGVINGVLFRGAEPFIDQNTIIPVFISILTPSRFFIGLATGLRLSGWYLPQMFQSNIVAASEFKHPTYITFGFFRIAAIIGIPLFLWLLGAGNPTLLLALFILLWGGFYFLGGICGISFVDVVAKTVPAKKLGGFWAARLFLGGLLAVGSGLIVKKIQASYEFPTDFTLIFTTAAVMIALAIFSWFFALEPRDKTVRPRRPFSEHIKENIAIFRTDSQFRNLFFFRSFFVFCQITSPYFIVFSIERLGIDTKSYLGYLVAAQTFGAIISNLLWAYMSNSERLGKSRGILTTVSAICVILPITIMALSFPALKPSIIPVVFVLFFLVGAVDSGVWLGFMNSLILISPSENRPIYLGLMNTLLGVTMLIFALSSGLIAQFLPFDVIFSLSALAATAAIIASRRLKPV